MTTFIVLFRGINVGGNKIAKMETLRNALTEAGFGNVATYIQSGNVVLTSDKDAAEVASSIADIFLKTFGFPSRPTVRSQQEWKRLIDENPYKEESKEHKKLHAVTLDEKPAGEAVEMLRGLATPTESFVVKDRVLYLHTPDGFGISKLAVALDKVLKVPLTARNWKTVLALAEMAEKTVKTEG
jgi:uncharacterized protein (DUF1697 family)